ncbi:glycosyltransferase [Microcoleus sp. FACHB-1515]|uniref:glycosyltransferase n=1 Tax=Cyanophyceae TaxID=3028117 RepID=UPI0016877650|nr:glycosyltransferase [Microcoleus sp. FACHB-1515]MBD2089967.1 glycosyltransferase [Microcoleus sp. FACHB-1515]
MSLPSASFEKISVIVPVRNEAPTLRSTVEQLQATLPDESEIIVVDDDSTDGGADTLPVSDSVRLLKAQQLGVARARNWGAAHATGDVLVFSDAHVNPVPRWWEPLLAALDHPNVGAVGPVISSIANPQNRGYGYRFKDARLNTEWMSRQGYQPYPVPMLCGCFLAMPRITFELVGGFDAGMTCWGSEDSELCVRLWLLGYELLVVPQAEAAHLFRRKHPYAVDRKLTIYNSLRLIFAHFSGERLTRVLTCFKEDGDFAIALARLADSDIWQQRDRLIAQRIRTDDWFCDRFDMMF